MAKILKNTTGSAIPIPDVGITVPASSSYTANPGEYYLLAASTVLAAAVTAGTIVVNDGHDDLKVVFGLRHLQEEGLDRDSAFIATGSVNATSNSTLTLTATSRLVIIFTGTVAGQIVALPNATTLQVCHRYEIWNTSTQSITVKNSAGTNIFIMAAAQKSWFTLQDNSTSAGIWLIEANFLGGTGGGNGTISYGFDGTGSSGRWLESLTNIPSNTTEYLIAGSKAIRAMSLNGAGTANYTVTVTLYKNGVVLDTISLAAQPHISKLNLNHILADLDQLSAQVTSGSIARPVFVVWL